MTKCQFFDRAAELLSAVALELDTAGENHFHWDRDGKESHVYFQLHPRSAKALGFPGLEIDFLVNEESATILVCLGSGRDAPSTEFTARKMLGERLMERGHDRWYRDRWEELPKPQGGREYTPLHELGTPLDVPAHVELHRVSLEDILSDEIKDLAEEVAANVQKFVCTLRTAQVFPLISQLREKWHEVMTAETPYQRGNSLEEFAKILFQLVPGFEVRTRARVPEMEVDLVILNRSENPFWSRFGPRLFVECKNWDGKIDVATVRVFVSKMEDRNIDCGILLSRNGVTRNAESWIGKVQSRGAHIIWLDKDKLSLICQSLNITGIIEQRFFESL